MINIQEQLTDGTSVFGWKSEVPLTPFAPNFTYPLTEKKIFSEEECESWYNYLLEQESILFDKYRTATPGGETGLGPNSLTTRYPYFNVLEFDFHLIPKLKTELFNAVKTILSIFDNTNWQETIYSKSWFNVLRKGEQMNPHFHGYHQHIFCGFHLSIRAKETFTSYYHPVTFPFVQADAFHVPNKVGYLTLFPDFVPHSVTINNYETPRISIAGDIFGSSMLGGKYDTDKPEASDSGMMNCTELGKL
jgi:hypothetical protein